MLTDHTTTIRTSVKDVQFKLMLTVALMIVVTFLFLCSVYATLVPDFTVPLSLIGAFGVMYLSGSSINNLTLIALTIATGSVVDDVIVMVEGIVRHLEQDDSPLEAALEGSEQIGFTIVSLTFLLIAMPIPLLFMDNVAGRLFRKFVITLAVTILISNFVSLTLTSMFSARLLRYVDEDQ